MVIQRALFSVFLLPLVLALASCDEDSDEAVPEVEVPAEFSQTLPLITTQDTFNTDSIAPTLNAADMSSAIAENLQNIKEVKVVGIQYQITEVKNTNQANRLESFELHVADTTGQGKTLLGSFGDKTVEVMDQPQSLNLDSEGQERFSELLKQDPPAFKPLMQGVSEGSPANLEIKLSFELSLVLL